MMDIQKMKELALEADRQVTWALVPFDLHKDEWETDVVNYIGAISPAAILELVERLEKAEKDFQSLDKQMSYLEQECTRQRDQLAERDPQIAALTAENVALKELVSDYAKHKTAFDDFDGDRRGIAEHLYEAEQALLSDHETPATNVAANALRAEGVNHAGKMVWAMLDDQDEGVGMALEIMAQVEMNYIKPAGVEVKP